MCRKDYMKIAEVFRAERPMPHWDANKRLMWDQIVAKTAVMLKKDNSLFDTNFFLEACGGLLAVENMVS
jgi:hypothetical protein